MKDWLITAWILDIYEVWPVDLVEEGGAGAHDAGGQRGHQHQLVPVTPPPSVPHTDMDVITQVATLHWEFTLLSKIISCYRSPGSLNKFKYGKYHKSTTFNIYWLTKPVPHPKQLWNRDRSQNIQQNTNFSTHTTHGIREIPVWYDSSKTVSSEVTICLANCTEL